ncbi:MAG TPA: baseplate J/gp47 family protein [Solirubrobacteraceae bacterium]|nr:baseplate J/gp47 family protein [Solirubrobacteraceae bacterium]
MALPSLYRTPEDYLAAAIEQVRVAGSQLTDFTTGSVTRTFLEALATAASEHSQVADQLRKDSYLVTAIGEALDAKAADQGVKRLPAVAATGEIQITREDTSKEVPVPIGWSELSTVPTAGAPSVTYITTARSVFPVGETTIEVPAVAVVPGAAGNLREPTPLVPLTPIEGLRSSDAYVALKFTEGVDEESDDDLRARIPIEVAGRVKGRAESFLAAVLRLENVKSAAVVRPGEYNGQRTLTANEVEVYYQVHGDEPAAVMTAVTAQVSAASMLGQIVNPVAAVPVGIEIELTVYARPGYDEESVRASVARVLGGQDGLGGVIGTFGCGETVRYGAVIDAVHMLPDVVTFDVPFKTFRAVSRAGETDKDIHLWPREYPLLSRVAVTVKPLPGA